MNDVNIILLALLITRITSFCKNQNLNSKNNVLTAKSPNLSLTNSIFQTLLTAAHNINRS